MDRPRLRLSYSSLSRLLLAGLLLVVAGAGAGCKAARPLVLPVVGSMGDPGDGGPWDDLDIYLIDPVGGGAAVRVTNTPDLMETDPDLNRDRDRLVYVERAVTVGYTFLGDEADRGREAGFSEPFGPTLIVCNTDGSNKRWLYESDHMCFTPVWSHDGKRIAFVELNEEGRLEVKVINADGSGLLTVGYGSSPSWRRDDGALMYSSLDRPDAAAGELQLRALNDSVIHGLGLSGTGHTNLRGGVSVAYSSPPRSLRNEAVWLMDANGGQFRLTEPGDSEHDLQPVFFGSEGELVFTRYDDEQGTYQLMRIHRGTQDKIATPVDQPAPVCFTRGGLWVARHYPR